MKKRISAAAHLAAVPACALILTCAMLLAGCSKNGDVSKDSGSGTPSQKVNATADDTAADTPKDTAKDTAAGDTSPQNTAAATTDSAVQTPDPEPEPPATQTPQPEPPTPQPSNAVEAAGGTVTVSLEGGAKVVLGAAESDVIPALGTYKDKLEAPSCVHPGNDVLYFYNGYTVTTSPDASGKNIVTGIELTSDAAKLTNGVTVGSAEDAAKAAFGGNFRETFGMLLYEVGASTVSIVCDAGTVSALAVTVEMK